MLLINAALFKNQLYKHQNLPSECPYHQEVRRQRALFQLFLHVILLMSAIYFFDFDLPIPGGYVEDNVKLF